MLNVIMLSVMVPLVKRQAEQKDLAPQFKGDETELLFILSTQLFKNEKKKFLEKKVFQKKSFWAKNVKKSF